MVCQWFHLANLSTRSSACTWQWQIFCDLFALSYKLTPAEMMTSFRQLCCRFLCDLDFDFFASVCAEAEASKHSQRHVKGTEFPRATTKGS